MRNSSEIKPANADEYGVQNVQGFNTQTTTINDVPNELRRWILDKANNTAQPDTLCAVLEPIFYM